MNGNHHGQSFSSLPRPQKTAVIILGVTAVAVFAIWIWQFNMRINAPFRPTDAEMAQGEKDAQAKIDAANASKTLDTDGDGLTDYDETTIYKTSPYLADTDGDGIPDGEEVRLGQNPLCNEKTEVGDCGLTASSTTVTQTVDTTSVDTTSVGASSTPAENVDQALLIKALSGQGDADTMRQILLQGGADPAQVNVLTDADLMSMYTDVLQSQNPGVIISTSTATSTSIN